MTAIHAPHAANGHQATHAPPGAIDAALAGYTAERIARNEAIRQAGRDAYNEAVADANAALVDLHISLRDAEEVERQAEEEAAHLVAAFAARMAGERTELVRGGVLLVRAEPPEPRSPPRTHRKAAPVQIVDLREPAPGPAGGDGLPQDATRFVGPLPGTQPARWLDGAGRDVGADEYTATRYGPTREALLARAEEAEREAALCPGCKKAVDDEAGVQCFNCGRLTCEKCLEEEDGMGYCPRCKDHDESTAAGAGMAPAAGGREAGAGGGEGAAVTPPATPTTEGTPASGEGGGEAPGQAPAGEVANCHSPALASAAGEDGEKIAGKVIDEVRGGSYRADAANRRRKKGRA